MIDALLFISLFFLAVGLFFGLFAISHHTGETMRESRKQTELLGQILEESKVHTKKLSSIYDSLPDKFPEY